MRSTRLLVSAFCTTLALTSCASTSSTAAPAGSADASTAAAAGPTTQCSYPADGTPAKAATPPPVAEPNTGSVTATLNLPGGPVTMKLDQAATPCTVGSFVHLAKAGYFDGTGCHRLTTGPGLDVLQCGDPSGTGGGGPGYSFADETTPSMTYPAGTVAMANAGPNTNGSQFFLVYADSQLPPNYTVFGSITGGVDVLTTIAAAGVSGGGGDGKPAAPATISTVTIAG